MGAAPGQYPSEGERVVLPDLEVGAGEPVTQPTEKVFTVFGPGSPVPADHDLGRSDAAGS